MSEFSATESVRNAWNLFKRRGWFLIGVTALMFVLSALIAGVASQFGDRDLGGFLGAVVDITLSTLLSMGFTAVMIHAHDAVESALATELWHPRPFWKFLAAELLTGLLICIGFILFIVPGIIAMLMFVFVSYLIIDKELGPLEAMRESRRITKGHRWELLLLVLLAFVLNVFGALALLVGLLVSIPVTMLALVHAYRTLEGRMSK